MANSLIREDIDHPNVLHVLIRKRAEILGEMDSRQVELQRLASELESIDATILIFDPEFDVRRIAKKKPVKLSHERFSVSRVVMQALRTSTTHLTTSDIGLQLMKDRGIPVENKVQRVEMRKRAAACLRSLESRGLAVRETMENGRYGWMRA